MNKPAKTIYGKTKIYSATKSAHSPRAVVVPGYGETLAHNRAVVDAIAGQGLSAFTYSPPRRRGDRYIDADPVVRQREVLLKIIEQVVPKGEKVDAAAHSLGAVALVQAATSSPERFRSLTLFQPAGIVGEQSFTELLGRVGKKVVKNQAGAIRSQDSSRRQIGGYAASADNESAIRFSARVAKAQGAGAGVLAKQPKLAVQEAFAAGEYDISEDLIRVHELGIPVNIVKSHNDELFDHGKVDAGYAGIADHVESISSVADIEARHDSFWMQPERTAKIFGQLISQS